VTRRRPPRICRGKSDVHLADRKVSIHESFVAVRLQSSQQFQTVFVIVSEAKELRSWPRSLRGKKKAQLHIPCYGKRILVVCFSGLEGEHIRLLP
jgi:hypothetical protein